jgi:hypothetical protein
LYSVGFRFFEIWSVKHLSVLNDICQVFFPISQVGVGLLGENQISQLDSVQRRAARFVSNNFQDREPGAVTSIISNLKWESLEQRCAKARTVLMYKIIHNLVEIRAEQVVCYMPVLLFVVTDRCAN